MRVIVLSETSLALGTYNRFDGEKFELDARVRETARTSASWSVVFTAHHGSFGRIEVSALIRKAAIPEYASVISLTRGVLAERVRRMLNDADQTGRPLWFDEQPGTWVLIAKPYGYDHVMHEDEESWLPSYSA